MESDTSGSTTVPNTPEPSGEEASKDMGLIGELHPLNRIAQNAFHALAYLRNNSDKAYHCSFLRVESIENPQIEGFYVLSLSNLPDFPQIGWRIGKGRAKDKNLGVDIHILLDEEDGDDIIAGRHARFAWVKGGGGLFLIADNQHGRKVTLNGTVLSNNQQMMIPFNNTIGIGECYFTFKFPVRTPKHEEQFQVELASFYSVILNNPAPVFSPTPSEHESVVGDWMFINPIARGTFGHVYAVTHTRRAQNAVAKELWRTRANARKVDEEVAIAKILQGIKHRRLATPFEIRHETGTPQIVKERKFKLLDHTWKPEYHDGVDRYLLFSPLAASTFCTLIESNASKQIRTTLFAQILEGLSFLHTKGIMHRDIKPSNLLVQSYDPPLAQITDFGCATTKPTMLYDRPGTIPYLAPEQRDREYHGRDVDYWACALVGSEVIGLTRPGLNTPVQKAELTRIHEWLEKRHPCPIAISCTAMLQWEPSERATADHVLRHVLADYHTIEDTQDKSVAKQGLLKRSRGTN